jgi:transcriptional regulator with XRE-family HTH domain
MDTTTMAFGIGERVRRLRQRRLKVSIQALADEVGMDRAYLSRLEAGKGGNVTLATLSRLADALKVPLAALLPARRRAP